MNCRGVAVARLEDVDDFDGRQLTLRQGRVRHDHAVLELLPGGAQVDLGSDLAQVGQVHAGDPAHGGLEESVGIVHGLGRGRVLWAALPAGTMATVKPLSGPLPTMDLSWSAP